MSRRPRSYEREIAKSLYIEESTAKLHAHHIYEQPDIRSRTALTVHALLERSDQATSATDERHPPQTLADYVRLTEVLTLREPVLLVRSSQNRLEGGDGGSVELTLDRLREPQSRDPARHGVAIRSGTLSRCTHRRRR